MIRKPGLSAMLRVKNEEQWIGPCLESIIDWFDEVVVCLQNCTDGTEDIARQYPVKIFHYHHDSWPNGPGYAEQDASNPNSRTYFYNWCLNKTRYTHVCKWDADMVAFDWLGERVHTLLDAGADVVWMYGVDIVGEELKHVGARRFCADEPRIFRVHSGRVCYVNGANCERLQGISVTNAVPVGDPAFLHFKWAKPLATATQAWPEGWENIPHFQNIIKRAAPKEEYNGEYPKCLTSNAGT